MRDYFMDLAAAEMEADAEFFARSSAGCPDCTGNPSCSLCHGTGTLTAQARAMLTGGDPNADFAPNH